MHQGRRQIMIDFTTNIDPSDVHFQIVRLGKPPDFVTSRIAIDLELQGATHHGLGVLDARLGSVSAKVEYEDEKLRRPESPKPGKIIPPESFGRLTGASADVSWLATGAWIVRRRTSSHPKRHEATFHLDAVTVRGSGSGAIAYTREVFVGVSVPILRTCLFTPVNQSTVNRDRIEERAFGRRITVRVLSDAEEVNNCPTAVVYDGPPLEGTEKLALWLACSLLAGTTLQLAVIETYDVNGSIIDRVYRPGVSAGTSARPPFRRYIAPYIAHTFGTLCDQIVALMESGFPIDVVIAHLHDGNDGTMERQMQSYLLAIHAASEAWNRLHEKTKIVCNDVWDSIRNDIVVAVRQVADRKSTKLGDALGSMVLSANNTSMGFRLRLFLSRIGMRCDGNTKAAIDLRNKLFHEGYLGRRYSTLADDARQERHDDHMRLCDFALRMVFSLCQSDVRLHSNLNPTESMPVRDATMTIHEDQALPGYQVEVGTPDEFRFDLPAIEALLERRGHVALRFLQRNLLKARVIAVARYGKEIVSVCMLKGPNPNHNASIRKQSGYPLPPDALELGYAATDEQHTRRGLGRRLNEEVLSRAGDMAFATVRMANEDEQRNLERSGFRPEGAPWKGDGPYEVGLWVRGP